MWIWKGLEFQNGAAKYLSTVDTHCSWGDGISAPKLISINKEARRRLRIFVFRGIPPHQPPIDLNCEKNVQNDLTGGRPAASSSAPLYCKTDIVFWFSNRMEIIMIIATWTFAKVRNLQLQFQTYACNSISNNAGGVSHYLCVIVEEDRLSFSTNSGKRCTQVSLNSLQQLANSVPFAQSARADSSYSITLYVLCIHHSTVPLRLMPSGATLAG